MNTIRPQRRASACPHDCPSTCALEVEVKEGNRIGRIHGAKDNSYTAGVICAKVARYSERIHHPDRLTQPLKRTGPKGNGQFEPVSWDDALDIVAENLLRVERDHGAEAVWPYYYAGTMGLVMRDGINRLRHAKNYSGQYSTICTTLSWTGYQAGTGAKYGVDPREMTDSDVIVIWGTNPVNTQVNVMTHATKARKERGTRIVCVDTYRTGTVKQSDMALIVKPGTDGALACAVMHVLFRDGYANWDFLTKYTDRPEDLERHLQDRTPEWASDITGLTVAEIEEFAHLIGRNQKSYFRLGYGFARSRNGAVNMHAVLSIPAVTGAWAVRGGGALHSNSGIFGWDKTMIEGLDICAPGIRQLDQSRIGAVLTGDSDALQGGGPVHALFIQNTNPMVVAPDLNKVHAGFAREDLFVCVHEQFMTETALMADIVLPATMFLEHDDLYQGGGHQHYLLGPKIIDGPQDCRNNHEVICALAARLGAEHPGFDMTSRELIDWTLRKSGRGNLEQLEAARWVDCQPPFEVAHFVEGFGHKDGKYHFAPRWAEILGAEHGPGEDMVATMPAFPDHWVDYIEEQTADYPFRLVTAPARNYLNSSFTETPSSIKNEKQPTVKILEQDAVEIGIQEGDLVELENERGKVRLHAEITCDQKPGVLIVESIWPNSAFVDGIGINALTGASPGAPVGGAAFHDNRVSVRPSAGSAEE